MAKVLDSLRSANAYPVPDQVISDIALKRGLDLQSEITREILSSQGYALAVADLMAWLAAAPNFSQEGISYNFSKEEKDVLINKSNTIYNDHDEPGEAITPKAAFGYKGELL